MPLNNTEIEANITAASTVMDANPRLSATKAVCQFSVLYQRLLARQKGRLPSTTRGGTNKKLSTVQDSTLKEYILMLHGCGTSLNLDSVWLATNWLLFYETGDTERTVLQRWTKAWLQYNSEYLKTLTTKPILTQRLGSHIVEEIK
jgi:hypothetical protein